MVSSKDQYSIKTDLKFYEALNVSRETFLMLEKFVNLLLKWNKKINLISKNSTTTIWQKHVIPSARLIKLIEAKEPLIMDVGSGAGFPGIVISIIKGWQVVLVEKNRKKCVFLKEAHKIIKSNIIIENKTIEETRNFSPDIIVSRGVTNISNFLKLTSKFLNNKVKVMLIKGDKCQEEIKESINDRWVFDYEIKPDVVDKSSTVVIMSNFKNL